MLNLGNITLVSIDGVGKNENHLKAIKYSTQNIKFKSVKYFSPINFGKNDFYEFIEIPKLTYSEYNEFCLVELYNHIETEYVIIVQDDGFILNPFLWNNCFLNYDYIGAPWPKEHLFFNTKRWDIVHKKLIESDIQYHVGNGGFSLRSKKLLNNVKNLYTSEYKNIPEDVLICIALRKELEIKGNNFAPFDVARIFSCETHNVNGIYTTTKETFGFHGRDTHYTDVSRLNTLSLI